MKVHVCFAVLQKGAIGLAVENQGHKAIGFQALPIHTYTANFTGLHKIFFKFSQMKGQNEKKYLKFDLFKEI